MLYLLFLIGIGLAGVTGRLVARAVTANRMALKAHLREIRDYGFEPVYVEQDLTLNERLKRTLRRLADRTGALMLSRAPSIPSLSASDLSAAGFYDITPARVHGYRVLAAIGLPGTIFLLIMASGKITALQMLIMVFTGLGGWQLPAFLIRRRGTARLEDIERQLPEVIDLLIATIEAGMGFAASLAMISERMTGPLGDELRLTMKQQSLGISIQQALDEMVERCDCPSVRAFVRTASRGESLGVSIGPVLRELSADERRRRGQAAREKMQKAPIKMIFPLMFLIFPALMIVLMYPAGYAVMKSLGGVGGG
ncbi:MAG: tight adherence protein [Solirubrobacteraceae bacterium]|jgi:tight adherence protein C|nr:tight adherence protein [Solirubrobacteraceae bacterium]